MIGAWLAVALGILLYLCCPDFARAAEANVQVSLFEAFPPTRTISVAGPFVVLSPVALSFSTGSYKVGVRGTKLDLVAGNRPGQRAAITAPRLVLRGATGGLALRYPGKQTRRYRGTITLEASNRGTLRITNAVAARDYVTAVVASESPPGWPREALKCQAVLTQTRLCRYRPGDPLGDSTQQEAYLGAGYERPEVKAAVDSVWGLTLTYDGRPIYPYYHAACAGRTSDGEQYFNMPGLLPYARSVECSHCFRSPFHGKKRSVVPYRVYQQALNGAVPVISRIDAAGRPVELMMDNGKSVSGYDFWIKVGQKLGWDKVPGTRYDLMVAKDGSVVFESSGAGHGVGLCQWGAAELARQGWSCRSILKHYFPGTRVAGR